MIAKATFGAGCFWGTQAAFQNIPGVTATAAGYEGGAKPNPTYEEVCSHTTGHAEVVQVEYDPALVSYNALLDVFWNNHNPTTLDRQGPDVGTQYRSAIFYHNEEQKALAEQSRQILSQNGKFRQPIVTQIVPASTFWVAEDYHQSYLEKHGLASCHV
jgi:peptide-methionine (S)-S-oxide reductase